MNLDGQTVMIIGGAAGMGLATARLLADAGAAIAIGGRSRPKLDQALQRLPDGVRAIELDLTDRTSLDQGFAELGAFDHLVLTASSEVAWGAFDSVPPEALAAALNQKLVGYFSAIQAARPTIRKDGSVTIFSGAATRKAMPGTAALAAVNGGLQALAHTLAKELAPLRVNTISPGLVETSAYDGMPEGARKDMFENAGRQLPIGRTGTSEEVAEVVRLLVGNAYVTGALWDVDGGTRL